MHNGTQFHRPEVMIKGQGIYVPLANTSEGWVEYSRTGARGHRATPLLRQNECKVLLRGPVGTGREGVAG